MPRLPESTSSSRLVIRRWTADDAAVLFAAIGANIEHLRPWMPWIPLQETMTIESEAELLRGWDTDWAAGGEAHFGVFLDGGTVGGTGLHRRVGDGGLEIGYWTHVDHVRKGYATEVARALTDLVFTVEGIDRVEIHHDQANVPSGRIPAALGYRKIGEIAHPPEAPSETGIRWIWRSTRTEWRPTITKFMSPQAIVFDDLR